MRIKVMDKRCKPEQHGDWCDLKFHELNWNASGFCYEYNHDNGSLIQYEKNAIFKVSLGVAMEIPEGYHAQIVPRSSTRKHYGVILTNSIGIIDNAYCGDDDIWMAEFYALQDGEMRTGDRVLQFRLVKNGDPIEFEYVHHLGNENRGGFGSTGKQ